VEDVIPIFLVAFHSQLNMLLSRCIQRVARSNLENISLEKVLSHEVVDEIKAARKKSETDDSVALVIDPIQEK